MSDIQNAIKEGLKTSTVTAQKITMEFLGKKQDVLLINPYGFMSNPDNNLLGIILSVENNEDNLVSMICDPKNTDALDAKEVKIGIPSLKSRVYFKNDDTLNEYSKGAYAVTSDDTYSITAAKDISIIAQTTKLIDIKNSISNLKAELQKIYTDINTLLTALNTFAGGNCVNGAPLTTAAAFQSTLGTITATVATDKNNVGQLLK
jgi:hypothetical protein